MPLHLGRSSADIQDQTREARRFLVDHVRNDWDYPEAPHILPFDYPTSRHVASSAPSASIDATVQVNAHIDNQATTTTTTPSPDFEPAGWRERTYSSGETSGDEEAGTTATKYETPEDVGTTITDKKARRKRKRQELLEEEMTWNIGLAHWSAQRNAWTCAQQRGTSSGPSSSLPSTFDIPSSRPSTSATSSPYPSTSAASSAVDSTQPPPTTTGAANDSSLLIPVAPPLLPNHPVRSRISTSTYHDIYTKIILQGRTPSIPINLQDITRSLVHGWKEEGNWPPKISPAEPSFARSRNAGGAGAAGGVKHPHLRKGVQAVGRVLGFGGPAVPVEAGRGQGQI